ncbi:ABC transporter permease [Rhizobium sp. FKY42]|uniref:ABC transporter permease n=1 Tax=Rhizobium sp. FKY42 TaxID=2562310 RepID=UPI0010C07311|nr:ABC transporter permease [Rhizobium sp. FKY42]
MKQRIDKLGAVIALIAMPALLFVPFVTFKANRIVHGQPVSVYSALPTWAAACLTGVTFGVLLSAMIKTGVLVRVLAACLGLVTVLIAIGLAAIHLTPDGNSFVRVSTASGFWLMLFALSMLLIDALARLRPQPVARMLLLLGGLLTIAAFVMSGLWNELSLLKEFSTRADGFWREAWRHLALAVGSLLAAFAIGLPLGILCYRVEKARAAILSLLNIIQTVPSIALFGLLIAPLGWIAANLAGASELGIRGIGAAPAFIALVLYALLPIVANTVSGLVGVDAAVSNAAKGLGMTDGQILRRIELPLAMPAILTAIRIVLVQNIGMATIAALIGGGGFGVFVFQGIGQTATDLVLLGALPTVALALCAAVIMDALTELATRARKETATA